MPTWLLCLGILTLSGLLDFLSLRWTAASAAGQPLKASFWAVCVEVVALTTVFGALSSLLGAFCAVVGSALGTYISVRMQVREST